MREGFYQVLSWNGKDGVITNDEGEFETLTLADLTPEFRGRLILEEKIKIKLVPSLIEKQSDDQRAALDRAAELKRQQKIAFQEELKDKERMRRQLYGVQNEKL